MATPRPGGPPLDEETQIRVEALFRGSDRALVSRRLVEECGHLLPLSGRMTADSFQRIRFAVLKVSGGTIAGFERALASGNQDWRDLLVEADFAHDTESHKRWSP